MKFDRASCRPIRSERNNGKKGFTIAELTVVIALISLIGVMVSAFSVIMYKRANSNRETSDFINEVSAVKKIVENAIMSGDENLKIENYTLTYTLDGEEISMPLVAIESATFNKSENGLYYCTLFHSRGETVFAVYRKTQTEAANNE